MKLNVALPVIVWPVVVPLEKMVKLLPDRVNVPDPQLIVLVPVPEVVIAPVRVGLLLFAEKSSVIPIAPQDRDLIEKSVATVIVPAPDEASIVTLSPATGTDCPPVPPLLDAQWVVSLASQVPVPPTQKRELIIRNGYLLVT